MRDRLLIPKTNRPYTTWPASATELSTSLKHYRDTPLTAVRYYGARWVSQLEPRRNHRHPPARSTPPSACKEYTASRNSL
ncbi:uncharacterized protein TRAVEDRAFT_28295 [Trametes versicolor FP-101664 SS1]|uniref:uncharacterized protein n=1 Tax=Trametes versicolor (strain FP-101664) TaxID=717944 RepID=UPI0004623A73|nr:uncharacterized protein TRAVEDRAFT_28295 [Trametes versicolor FP-101664 SS1]EIW60837.1 hypothetical protein TRAVEDRAFT_28295 [Trametes versicolor FP-101664 SS1]